MGGHGNGEYIEVHRQHLLYRITHWGIVSTGLIVGFTGLRLGGIWGVNIPSDYELALKIHVYTALVFAFFWVLMFLQLITHEWKWFGFHRFPYSIKFLIAETKAWLGIGPHVEDPRCYDPKIGDYREKIIPTEVMVPWAYIVLTLIMGLTGLPLYWPEYFHPIIALADKYASIFGLSNGVELLRVVHRLVMFIYLMIMLIHAYACFVFGVITSMITGKRKERVCK